MNEQRLTLPGVDNLRKPLYRKLRRERASKTHVCGRASSSLPASAMSSTCGNSFRGVIGQAVELPTL